MQKLLSFKPIGQNFASGFSIYFSLSIRSCIVIFPAFNSFSMALNLLQGFIFQHQFVLQVVFAFDQPGHQEKLGISRLQIFPRAFHVFRSSHQNHHFWIVLISHCTVCSQEHTHCKPPQAWDAISTPIIFKWNNRISFIRIPWFVGS